MKRLLLWMGVSALLAGVGLAQNREHVAIQRDIGLLQDQIRVMQGATDEKLAAITALLQQTLDAANKSTTTSTTLERDMKERMTAQEKSLVAPVAGLGSKIDELANEFRFVRESISELQVKVNKLETRLVDLDNAVKILATPPPPPPVEGAPAAVPGVSSGPPQGMSADTLYTEAERDRLAGRADLAIASYKNYVAWYGTTDLACEAQYYIGDIEFQKKQLQEALGSFDNVLERYPSSCRKRPDAMYMKAQTLREAGYPTEAAKVYRELLKEHPTGAWATKAKAGLQEAGYSVAPPPTSSKKKTRRR